MTYNLGVLKTIIAPEKKGFVLGAATLDIFGCVDLSEDGRVRKASNLHGKIVISHGFWFVFSPNIQTNLNAHLV